MEGRVSTVCKVASVFTVSRSRLSVFNVEKASCG